MELPMQLSNRAFWDVDFNALDYQKHKAFIIEKAFDRGSWQDMKWCVKHYGKEEVVHSLKKARSLRPEVLRLVSVLFEIPENEFRCYNFREQNLQHSNY
jgi:hypothetical protein